MYKQNITSEKYHIKIGMQRDNTWILDQSKEHQEVEVIKIDL